MWKSLSRLMKRLLRSVSKPFSNSYRYLRDRRTLRLVVKRQSKLSLRLQNLDKYLASLPQPRNEPKSADGILARAGIHYRLVRDEGWVDVATRTKAMLEGLRRDLERNPFDPKTGRDRSDELRAMIFGMQRVLDVPQKAIDAADALNRSLKRQHGGNS